MMQQLITPTPNIPCTPGYCLQYVRETYGLPARYGSATEAWDKSASQHPDRDFPPGIWVPVWFSIDTEPNGHVALLTPDGSVYSSSDLGSTPHLHPDIEDLIAYYAYWGKMQVTYLGWTEDVAGYPVMAADTITAQSGTITPIQEADMPLSGADHQFILEAIDDYFKNVRPFEGNRNIIDAINQTRVDVLSTKQVAAAIPGQVLFDNRVDGRNLFDWFKQTRADVANTPAAVLNQSFKLPDGTVTNLAGILTAIHAQPVAGTSAPADPTAVIHALRDQLNK